MNSFTIFFDKENNELILRNNTNDKIADEHFVLSVLTEQQLYTLINNRISSMLTLED